jgi:hypothetical protein
MLRASAAVTHKPAPSRGGVEALGPKAGYNIANLRRRYNSHPTGDPMINGESLPFLLESSRGPSAQPRKRTLGVWYRLCTHGKLTPRCYPDCADVQHFSVYLFRTTSEHAKYGDCRREARRVGTSFRWPDGQGWRSPSPLPRLPRVADLHVQMDYNPPPSKKRQKDLWIG